MTEISLERIASALGYSEKPNPDTHRYATVSSINPDGSYQVTFNGAVQPTRAVKLCDAEVGDRVLCVLHEGQVAAIGRVGGSGGGGSESNIDLLWTNPNPTSAFAAQNVPDVPWQDYKLLIIEHYTDTYNNIGTHTETNIVIPNGAGEWSFIVAHREVNFIRGVKMVTQDVVYFGNCLYYGTWNNGTFTSNSSYPWVVPTRIWGVK